MGSIPVPSRWKCVATAAGVAFASMSGVIGPASADIPESDNPIKIAVNEWTGQHISAHIAGAVLAEMGYSVEFITAGALPQFQAIAQGELHVQPEVWTNSVSDIYPKAIESGDIVNLGLLGLQPQEGWIYPPYMAEKCPGLPDFNALYECTQAFATSETFPNGRLVTYPADWGTRSKDVVEAIGLPFTPVPGGSEGAMVAEIDSAIATGDPILIMFWQPHWLFAVHDLEWVQWNDADGECVEETQTREMACGFQQATVDKIVSGTATEEWPGAVRLLGHFTLTNAEHNHMINEIDQNKRALEDVVQEWMGKNQDTWKSWISASM
ncbi:MAG: ABC transporter substrate-binding protein [Paracoccaceae bacterium]|nr:ABC transporter substrate-binding protein [Paracoccaceae bacterium]